MGNAAEKFQMQEPEEMLPMPKPEETEELTGRDLEEIEDLTDKAIREKDETEEALGVIERIGWSKEAEKRNQEATIRRKADIEFKKLETSEKMGMTDRLPDMTDQAVFADPNVQAAHEKDKANLLQARKDIFLGNVEKRRQEEGVKAKLEEIHTDIEKVANDNRPPVKKKSFFSKFFGKK